VITSGRGVDRPGDDWIGDPPHETPGWYSVYNKDESTVTLISAHAMDMAHVQDDIIKEP
jgi:mannan endo-1,4-beta-mannosidase